MNKEIEKKYQILYLPDNLSDYDYKDIEQSYLNFGSKPAMRLRMFNNNEYILSAKVKKDSSSDLQVCDEYEIPLSKDAYSHLKSKVDGRVLYKRRYIIPIDDGLKVELDLFGDFFDGVGFAEIEFSNEEQSRSCKLPDWIGKDITSDDRVTNDYMAIKATSIEEYSDLIIKAKIKSL